MRTRTIQLVRRPVLAVLMALVVSVLLVVSLAGPAGADDDDDDGGEFVSRQVVVELAPGTRIGYINKKYNTATISRLPGAQTYLLKIPRRANPDDLAARIERNEQPQRVVYAEPNFRAGLPEASKPHKARPGGVPDPSGTQSQYRDQYAVGAMNLPAAHGVNEGAGSVVAVIDTGVQANHEALSGRLTQARYDFVDGDRNPADVGNGRDDDRDEDGDEGVGHGTHVAGIVALTAPEARIMPVRALDSEGRGTTFGVARAITFAVDNGAHVVNLSLGSSQESDLLEDVLGEDDDDDDERSAVFVAAAGNDSDELEQYPAAEDGAIAVTAVGQNKMRSDFANFDTNPPTPWIDISAPGTGIYGPFPTDRYALWEGTSMATPFVAGQAALIHSASGAGRINPGCVTDVITSTAQPLPNQEYSGRLGSGHADAGASVTAAQANPCRGGGDD